MSVDKSPSLPITFPASLARGTLLKRGQYCQCQITRKSAENGLFYKWMHYQDGKMTITMDMLTWKAGRNFCVVPTIDKKLQAISDVRGELPSPRDEHLCQLSCFLKEYIQWINEINESEETVNWGLRYRFKTLHDHLRFNNSPHSLVDFNVLNCFHLHALKPF